ncbi:MAG TPA: hypothetical protein V6C91_00540 [Coleofasciculaceae cyanobacterium]
MTFEQQLQQIESAIAALKLTPEYQKLEKYGFLDTQAETAEGAIASLRCAHEYMMQAEYGEIDEILGFEWEPLEELI